MLPSEYQQVEYIESTGTQYIDTGFKPNQDTRVVADFQSLDTTLNFLFGARESYSSKAYSTSYYHNEFGVSYGDSGNVYIAPIDTNRHTVDFNKNVVSLGTITYAFPTKTFSCPSNLCLFVCNQNGTNTGYGLSRIFSLKVYDSGTLIRDYIPCYRKADNVIGLYDLANGVFYTNKGTGTFTKGKEIYTMSATIKGANLFVLGESNYTVGKVYTNLGITYTVQADGGIHCKGTKTSPYSYFTFMRAYIQKYGQGTYSLGVYGENIPNKIEIEFRKFNANGVSIQTGLARVGVPVTRTLAEGETLERFSVIVSTEGEVDFVVYPMLNTGNPLPYEPYFNNTIEIPPRVTLADGTELALRFAKQGNKADKLIVDKIGGKVLYEKNTDIVPLPTDGWGAAAASNQVKTLRVSININTSISNVDYGASYLMNKFIKTFDATVDEPSFYQATGSLNPWLAIRVDRGLLETQDSAGIKKWLQAQQDEGDPVLIQYAFRNPKTYDLTNTELGQRLLEWAKNTKNQTNIIEITSELNVSKTSVDYAKWGGSNEV